MKNRSSQFTLFTFLFMLLSPQFFRLVFSTPLGSTNLQLRDACDHSDRALVQTILNRNEGHLAHFSKAEIRRLLTTPITKNNSEIIDDILKNFVKEEIVALDYLQPFLLALNTNHHPTLMTFLQYYPNLVHWVIDLGTLHQKKPQLAQAEKLKDGKLLEHAFRLGADPDNEGNTFPLRHAILSGMWKYAEMLLDQGAFSAIFIQPGMPLQHYLEQKNPELLIKILSRNETLDPFQVAAGLLGAIRNRRPELISLYFKLLPNRMNEIIEIKSGHMLYPIHAAVVYGNFYLLELLKQMGANLNLLSGGEELSALAYAIMLSNNVAFDSLLEWGVEPSNDASAYPLMHLACHNNNFYAARKILERGYHLGRLLDGRTALEVCEEYNHVRLIELLKEYGATKPIYPIWFRKFYSENQLPIWQYLAAINFIIMCATIYLCIRTRKNQLAAFDSKNESEMTQLFQEVFREFYQDASKVENQNLVATLSVVADPLPIKRVCKTSPDKDFDCTISFETVSPILLKHLKLQNAIKPLAGAAATHRIILADIDLSWVQSANKNKIIQNIRNELYDEFKKTPAYQAQKHAYEQEQLKKKIEQLEQQRLELRLSLLDTIEKAKASSTQNSTLLNTVVDLANNAAQFVAKHKTADWESSRRIQKPFEALLKEINKYNPQAVAVIQLQMKKTKEMLDQLELRLHPLDLTTEQLKLIQSELQAPIQQAHNQKILTKPYAATLDGLQSDIFEAIEKHEQDSKRAPKVSTIALTLEQKKAQREQEELQKQAEQLRSHLENEEKKRLHRTQLEEQRKQKEEQQKAELERQERRRVAELKRREELQRTQSSTSSTSSTSLKPIIKDKVLTLGDLIQRAQNEDFTDHTRIQYRYALLAQCLRIFELTDKSLPSKICNDIRNALMHQHRYFDLETLIDLAESIAHKPSGSASTSIPKFEDILNDLRQQATSQLEDQLRRALLSLTLTDFYKNTVQTEAESPTAIEYLESIVHFTEDLSMLNIKLEQGLLAHPDKILAIKGILMCVGECYQQLRHLKQDGLLTENQNEDFVHFIKTAKNIRDQMAHTVREPLENEGLYLKFLRQAEVYQQIVEIALDELKLDHARSLPFH